MQPASADATVNMPDSGAVRCTSARTVALVDAGPDALPQLDCSLEMGCYALMFLDSRMRPHTDIKFLHPSVVILFLRRESASVCQLLTLLKLDPETRNIPVRILLAADGESVPTAAGDVMTSPFCVD